MYKIFYHHCNKCLYPSLWNIALKDIKTHSPHKMTWMEKVSKLSTILHRLHSTVHWIPSAVWWGPMDQATNTTSSTQHATSLSSVSRTNIEWVDTGYWVWWLFQPFFDCRLHSCTTCKPTQIMKKEQQYLFLFNMFYKNLKHLTYIWYYTMGLCN